MSSGDRPPRRPGNGPARGLAAQEGFRQLEVQAVDLGEPAATALRGGSAAGLGTGGFDLAWWPMNRSTGTASASIPMVARGVGIGELLPLPVLGRGGDAWARWLERFVTLDGRELIRQGHWWEEDAAAAAAAMARARLDPGAYWVGPTVLALRARRGEDP